MCLAIPGRVKKIEGRKAWVGYDIRKSKIKNPAKGAGRQKSKINEQNKKLNFEEIREAMIGEEGVKVGDWVMVQMGIIMRVLNEQEAEEMLQGWRV